VDHVVESFAWPLRGPWSRWIPGVICVAFVPLLFVPLLGYAIAATRTAQRNAAEVIPAWSLSPRMLADGFWTALVIALTLLPFALVLNPLAGALRGIAGTDLTAYSVAVLVLALPWGLLALAFLPHATAAFAATGRPADLFNLVAAVRHIPGDFPTWNVAVGAIVTAWAIGLASAGLLCVGLVPGIFYAILVSAHATAALDRAGTRPPTG